MNVEEQDAVLGRSIRRRSELNSELVAIEQRLSEFGLAMSAVGDWLSRNPKALSIDEAGISYGPKRHNLANLDGETLHSTIARYREVRDQIEKIDDGLRQLGLNP